MHRNARLDASSKSQHKIYGVATLETVSVTAMNEEAT